MNIKTAKKRLVKCAEQLIYEKNMKGYYKDMRDIMLEKNKRKQKVIDELLTKIEETNEMMVESTPMLESAIKELQFEKMQVDVLYNVLGEIIEMSEDKIVIQIAEMAQERHQVDKLLHARNLFPKTERGA